MFGRDVLNEEANKFLYLLFFYSVVIKNECIVYLFILLHLFLSNY